MRVKRPTIVYQITCVANRKAYIGMTTRGIKTRWKFHCYEANYVVHRDRKLSRAIRKHGSSAFVIVPLYEAASEREAAVVERALIAQYGTFRAGYNSTIGGEGFDGVVQSAEVIERRRQKSIGLKRSPEICKKFSEIAKARPPMSAEHRAKIGLGATGRTKSEETRRKISEAKKGIPRSAETKAKVSASKMGVPRSAESVEKQRVSMSAVWSKKREATTHCRNGHAFTEDNIASYKPGERECRACINIRAKRNYHRRQQEARTWH